MTRALTTAIAIAIVLAGAGCQTKVVDLGRVDAPIDTPVDARRDATLVVDATSCRCRITPCRVSGDCALVGGVCGTDNYCVGDFGPCTSNAECQATATGSVCTTSTSSTASCR